MYTELSNEYTQIYTAIDFKELILNSYVCRMKEK